MVHNIYIAEDYAVMTEMLQEYLLLEPDLKVVGTAKTAQAALEQLSTLADLHLLLIDVSLPDMSGLELAKEVHSRWPDLLCLMYSGHQEISYARRALENGSRGYVLKGDPDELTHAMRRILCGEIYVSDPFREELSKQFLGL